MTLRRQIFWFGIIGAWAALMHYMVFLILNNYWPNHPLFVNIIAFACAFWISYFGHRYLTFEAHHLPHHQTLLRFIPTAFLGFIINEGLLFIMVQYTNIPYWIGIPLIITISAVCTFMLSRSFAFKPSTF